MKGLSIFLKGFGRGGRKKGGHNHKYNENEEIAIDWEVRPGGLLVQRRGQLGCDTSSSASDTSGGGGGAGPMIKINVSHDSYLHDVSLPSQSTFGDLKRVLAHKIQLEPKDQRLLFRGKEKDDEECLHMAGVKDMSKVILLEDPASKHKKLEEMGRIRESWNANESILKVRLEVDKLSNKVVTFERSVKDGVQVTEKELVVLTELLMVELLKLDSIEADGEAKVHRRIEVHRIQSLVDVLDDLKVRNCNFSSRNSVVKVQTEWETFDSGIGSLTAPKTLQTSTKVTHNWEQFD